MIKQFILNSLSEIPFLNRYFSGDATILMLHRVSDLESNKLHANEHLKVSPYYLEKFIIHAQQAGYEFISLDKLHDALTKKLNISKKLVLTFDDGYKDNYENAFPILSKYNIPFCIYITTSFPNKNARLWWYALEEILIQNENVLLGGNQYSCKTLAERNDLFLKIRNILLHYNQKKLHDELDQFFVDYPIDWKGLNDKLCMSWDDIIALSQTEICTIAGHTKNHYSLNQLGKDGVRDEIVGANEEIEKVINKKIEHFAYPFGSSNEIGQREFDIVKSLGFKTTTTTRRGTIYQEHVNHLECLPRIMLTEEFKMRDIGKIRKNKIVTL